MINAESELAKDIFLTGGTKGEWKILQPQLPAGHYRFHWATVAVYEKPCWFHRVMTRLLLGAVWVPANAKLRPEGSA